ncbi:MAG: triose-phosphate isomerase [Kiritimatiellae bacterium]|jgi:triosephosphate isomerase|nr:triose-phosphate isomerase [Kiritimatiellia bacterium]MDD4118735.1 triose-phosphate isomerase [Kiritimatiellia bacterium]HPC58476.1 triose-phosphate isomerase [Kiritimatiellia bacterium]
MRKKIVAGNWKMNMTTAEAASLVTALKADLANFREAEVVVCPPFTALATVSELVQGTHLDLGAQNMHWEKGGAYTGEISAGMLRELYCHYVILGHSERRQYFGETDEIVNRKAKAALASSLHPIVCVGETLEQREAGQVESVITTQVQGSLAGLSAKELLDSVIAYEPVWAIGTGKTASSEQAQEVHALIRKVMAGMHDETVAQSVRIQYGGSVKPGNARELFGMPDIDGGLIGGAALDAKSFIDIVRAAV